MSKKIFSAQDWENVPSEIQQAHTPSITLIYNKVKESTGNDNDDFFRRIRMFVNSNTGSRPQYPVMTGETDRFRITDIIQ